MKLMVAEKYLETPKRRGWTWNPSAGILARQESPYHTKESGHGFPTARGVRGGGGGTPYSPDEGPCVAAQGFLALHETVKSLEKAQRPWHVGGELALFSWTSLFTGGKERRQTQGDTPAVRWRVPGSRHGAGHAGPPLDWEAACHQGQRVQWGCGDDGSGNEVAHNQEHWFSRPKLHILCLVLGLHFAKDSSQLPHSHGMGKGAFTLCHISNYENN